MSVVRVGHVCRQAAQDRAAGRVSSVPVVFILLLLASWVTAGPARAVDSATLVSSLGERVILVLKKDEDAAQRRADFEGILYDFFDMPEIARLVLGRHWRKADPEQQERYVDLFGRYIVAVYSGQFGNYGGQTFNVLQSRAVDRSEEIVSAEVRGTDGPPVILNFRLHQTAEGPRIVDVMVEGVSMLITMREEFSSIVNREGIEGLLRRLESNITRA